MTIRVLAVILSVALLSGAAIPGPTTLADRYRTGPIDLRFYEDWTSNLPSDLVFESRGDIAVAPDGSVFVSNTSRHTIFKFGPTGRFIKKFGQRGQGPGDLTYPGRISILDGRYLVVGEYATNQRISLFDLEGKFVKVVNTGRPASHPVALKNGKIAFVSFRSRMDGDRLASVEDVYIIDMNSGAQKSIVSYSIQNPMKPLPGGGLVTSSEGGVAMAQTGDGGLVVGTTQSPNLDIFSTDGVKLRTLDTGWKAIRVTAEYRAKYQAVQRREAEAEGQKLLTDEPLLLEVLPLLRDVWTDSEGNILVSKRTECLEDCPLVIRAYSPDGEFLRDVTIEPGPFALSADWRFKRIVLTGAGLYGLLELKDDPDGYLHLVRTVFRPQ